MPFMQRRASDLRISHCHRLACWPGSNPRLPTELPRTGGGVVWRPVHPLGSSPGRWTGDEEGALLARVILPKPLAAQTGGQLEFEIDARNVRGLIRELERLFPGIEEGLADGVAVAIDGEIVTDALLESIDAESEVHFLPRVGGG